MKKIFVVAALIYSSLTGAQQDTASKTLSDVVVTANRFPQKQNTTGKVVTVITQEVLSRSIGKTVPELLNQQAGITVIGAQNNLGTNQDVFLQGASSGKTLILIDGIPAYDPSTISTAFDINHFPIDNIERIEIVRGALSTLYGSDAVAGVINIITKKGGSKPLSFYGTVAGGSFGTFKGVAGINGAISKSRYNLQYSRLQADGFSSAYDSSGTKNFDNDEYEQNALSGNFSSFLTEKLQVKLNGAIGKYETGLDASGFNDEKDYTFSSRNIQAGTGLEYRLNKGTLHVNYNYNNNIRDYLDDSAHVGGFAKFTKQKYTGRSHIAEIYSNFDLTKNINLLVGGDYRYQNTDQNFFSISSFGPYESNRGADSTKMNQHSVFATFYLKAGGLNLELGGRYNDHSVYGNNFTYSFNPSFLINDQLKLFSNIGSAFKAPSLFQLFVINKGEKPLEAETSRTIDGGIEFRDAATGVHARGLYFNRRVENGIEYSFLTFDYFNNNLQTDRGAEVEAGIKLSKLTLNANYTYVTGEVNTVKYRYDAPTFSYVATGDTTFNNLFRRPKHTLNLTLGFAPIENLYFNAHVRLAGKRFEPVFMGAPIVLRSYQTVDFYTEYKFTQKIKAFADLKNITNERFFDIRGYNSRRFNFMAGVNVNF